MPAVPTLGGDTTGPQVPRQWPGQPSATHAAAVPAHSGTKKAASSRPLWLRAGTRRRG